uniref:Uncharacterized protein n=1 Tax=Cacopsylla melanoneura TaxID=428564 RepID=A0A8D8LQJ1_9HEMI
MNAPKNGHYWAQKPAKSRQWVGFYKIIKVKMGINKNATSGDRTWILIPLADWPWAFFYPWKQRELKTLKPFKSYVGLGRTFETFCLLVYVYTSIFYFYILILIGMYTYLYRIYYIVLIILLLDFIILFGFVFY